MKVLGLFHAALLMFAVSSPVFAQKEDVAEKAKLAKLEKAYATAKTAFAANAKSKKPYVDATVKYATAVMLSPALGPKDKYPKALRLYREALKHDPKNKTALESKKTIEDIYRSMGRPIPKE